MDDELLAAEQRARVLIDRQLFDSGWFVQSRSGLNLFAGIYKINQKDVERVVLPLPTMPQQVSLATDVSAFHDSVERLDTARATSVARSQALRHALLAAAFSGRVT